MAILLSNFVWEGTSLERPGVEAKDGHVYKELDTGESYIHRNGTWEFINLGLSFIKATKSGLITTDANGFYHVTFTTPFISNDYSVALSVQDNGGGQTSIALFTNISNSGFDIYTRKASGPLAGSVTTSWVATRNYNP